MHHWNDSTIVLIGFIFQLIGLASVVAARFSERSYLETLCRASFWVCLLAVGTAAMGAIMVNSPSWCTLGGTFALMSVGGTIDLRREPSTNVL